MDRYILLNYFIVLCVFVFKSNLIIAYETENVSQAPSEISATTITKQDNDESDNASDYNEGAEIAQRSIDTPDGSEFSQNLNADRHEAFRRRAKPLKSIFMGIYKNYKSTYLGNKTIAEYKRTLRTHAQKDEESNDKEKDADMEGTETNSKDEIQISTESAQAESNDVANSSENQSDENESNLNVIETKMQSVKKKKKKQRVRKRSHRRKKHGKRHLQAKKEAETKESPIYNYEFGPAVNMSLDLSNEIVKLHLDGENLQDVMQGRWFKDKTEGRGKKYEMITRVLPLFIIPFLIQSAVVPFLVMKLKLLLMKSILVGKLAIFLLVISAIKNSNKMMQTYEVAPSYWAGEPSRRSELAAASVASAGAYNGYRVEGKPTAWIN